MTDAITPENLRARVKSLATFSASNKPMMLRGALAIAIKELSVAADEIERLQSDVTELMSACNKALNAK